MDITQLDVSHWHWLALGIVLIILEMLTGGGFLLWIGLSACMVFLLSWCLPSMGFDMELLAFSLGAIVVSVLWWWYLKRNPIQSDLPDLNQRAAQYIGRVFDLDTPMENGRGRIKIGDTVWRVEGEDMSEGTKVRVTSCKGVILIVERAE